MKKLLLIVLCFTSFFLFGCEKYEKSLIEDSGVINIYEKSDILINNNFSYLKWTNESNQEMDLVFNSGEGLEHFNLEVSEEFKKYGGENAIELAALIGLHGPDNNSVYFYQFYKESTAIDYINKGILFFEYLNEEGILDFTIRFAKFGNTIVVSKSSFVEEFIEGNYLVISNNN